MSLPENFRCTLAATCDDISTLMYPVVASPKCNGVRMIVSGGVGYSRSGKPLPNKHLQQWCKENAEYLENLDGEVLVGDILDEFSLNKTTSGINSIEGCPDFTYVVFDLVDFKLGYQDRLKKAMGQLLQGRMDTEEMRKAVLISHKTLTCAESLMQFHKENLEIGYEGTITRLPNAPYKQGRSTAKQQYLMKCKPMRDSEFVIIGYFEEMQNTNEKELDERGYAKRSTKKDGMIPKGTLGGFICKTPDGDEFRVGSGFTAEMRREYWQRKDEFIGKLAKVKYFEVGMDKVPLLPVFLDIRMEIDL